MLFINIENKDKESSHRDPIYEKIKEKFIKIKNFGGGDSSMRTGRSSEVSNKQRFFEHLRELRQREKILTNDLKDIHKPRYSKQNNYKIINLL